MLILGPILIVITTTSALSNKAIITKVYVTTHITILPNEPHCDPKCKIANKFLSGEIGTDIPWIWGRMTGKQLINIVCTKDRCKDCGFCVDRKVLQIGGGQ